jgi:DNA-binding response OmpR family regulator
MPRVMIIDDDRLIRQGLAMRLRSAGFDALATAHPDEALRLALRNRPDAILLDIDIPGFSGLDFHDCLRVTERGRDIPVIYLSGHASAANRADAFSQGARAFIAKPYEPQELIATLTGIIAADARRRLSAATGG